MVEQAGGEGWCWAWASGQRRSEREAEEERHGGDRRIPARGRRQAAGMGPADDGNGWIRPLGTGSGRMWARTARAAQIRAKKRRGSRAPANSMRRRDETRGSARHGERESFVRERGRRLGRGRRDTGRSGSSTPARGQAAVQGARDRALLI